MSRAGLDKRARTALKRLGPALGARTLEAARALKAAAAAIDAIDAEAEKRRAAIALANGAIDPSDLVGVQAHGAWTAAERKRIAALAERRAEAEAAHEEARTVLARAHGEEKAVERLIAPR